MRLDNDDVGVRQGPIHGFALYFCRCARFLFA